jgi:hypothetical protein
VKGLAGVFVGADDVAGFFQNLPRQRAKHGLVFHE